MSAFFYEKLYKRVFKKGLKLRIKKKTKIRLAIGTVGILLIVFSLFRKLPVSGQNTLLNKENLPVFTVSTTFETEPVKIDERFIKESKQSRHSRNKVISQELPPKKIIIPSLNIDLPVETAKVVNGYWQVFEDKTGFGEGSAFPGNAGNTVIFAHAREGLFLPLKNIKEEDKIYILTDKRWHEYKVIKTYEVSPDQLEVIAPTEDETLTLYTCSGFTDNKRLIVVGKKAS